VASTTHHHCYGLAVELDCSLLKPSGVITAFQLSWEMAFDVFEGLIDFGGSVGTFAGLIGIFRGSVSILRGHFRAFFANYHQKLHPGTPINF